MGKFYFDFSEIEDKETLLIFLGIDDEIFYTLINKPSYTFQEFYIPKKRGKNFRRVFKINNLSIASFYKYLNKKLQIYIKERADITYPHKCSYGYIKGKNILENAQCHAGAKYIQHVDIKNFFNSITKQMVIKL